MLTLHHAKKWLALIACYCLMLSGNAFAQSANSLESFAPPLPDLGIYQVPLEGVAGTGGLLYRLEFNTNGDVLIEKKFNGRDLSETHRWDIKGDSITILPLINSTILDFDRAELTVRDTETILVNLNVVGASLDILEKDVKFELFKWDAFTAKFSIIMSLVVMLLLNEIFRYFKWSGFIFFVGLSAVLSVLVWPNQGIVYWFKWAKIYSVVTASVFFLLMRFTKIHQYRFSKMFCVFFLAGNIAEAAAQDFSMGFTPNMLNGVAGVLSILTCYYGWKGIKADSSPQQDMIWPKMTVLWIIAYDVWNFVYVYLNFPASASAQLMVILAATIPAILIKKGTWLQARAYTLAAWFMFYFTFPEFYTRNMWVFPRNDTLTYSLAALSLILNIMCVIQLIGFYKAKKHEGKPIINNA
jgi:hypothetical protein